MNNTKNEPQKCKWKFYLKKYFISLDKFYFIKEGALLKYLKFRLAGLDFSLNTHTHIRIDDDFAYYM